MFSDLVGSTALSARMDPEDLREVISAYQKCVAQTVQRFGGFVAKYMGDGVLVYFGYPQAHEDDAERAVRAGLELVAAVSQLKSHAPLQTRVGIATGLVVVGDLIGSGASQEQAIVGETPNLAARLQGVAEPNSVVIAESTRRLVGKLFELQDLGAQDLKGIASPVQAWAALRPSSVDSRFEALRAITTPLVGRSEEIELLLRRWEQAKVGDGCAVLISGEPGIGKSRVAQTIVERLANDPHIRLRYFCSPHHQDSALYPSNTQLERAAGFRREDTDEQRLSKLETVLAQATNDLSEVVPLMADLLSIPTGDRYPPLNLSPQKRKEKILQAQLAQVEGLASRQPVLMVFEDVHWSDPTTRESLDLLIDRLPTLRVLVILTFRPEFAPPWIGRPHVALISLNRLPPRQRAEMIVHLTGGKVLPKDITDQIVDRTDGVPLFIEELTKTVVESGIVTETTTGCATIGPVAPLAIPTSLHASLLARLDRLAPTREVAQIGAALGRQFTHELISAVALMPQQKVDEALAQLAAAELVFRRGTPPDAEYSFKHALVQDAAYSTLLRGRRQQLHARIATTLESQFRDIASGQPEIVARHCTEAGMSEAAIGWWRQAGELALRRSAFTEAIAHLDKAIGLVEGLADGLDSRLTQLRLQIAKGNALIASQGHHAHATTAAFARARDLASQMEDAPERFSAYYGMWVGSLTRAELAPAQEIAEAFLRDAERQPESPIAGIAHRSYGMTCWFQGDFVGARQHTERVLEIYDQERDRELAFKFGQDYGITATSFLTLVLWPLGEVDRSRRVADEAVAQALREGHVPTVYMVRNVITAPLEMMRGDSARAMPHLQASFNMAREHGMQLPLLTAAYGLAWARWHAGIGDAGAAAEMRDRRAALRKIQYRLFDPLYAKLLADVEAGTGNVKSALDVVSEALSDTEQSGQSWFNAELHRTRGEFLLQRHPVDIAAAETALKRAIEVARSQQARAFELRASLSLAKLYQTECRYEAARELLAPVYGWFTEGFDTRDLKEAKALLEELA